MTSDREGGEQGIGRACVKQGGSLFPKGQKGEGETFGKRGYWRVCRAEGSGGGV